MSEGPTSGAACRPRVGRWLDGADALAGAVVVPAIWWFNRTSKPSTFHRLWQARPQWLRVNIEIAAALDATGASPVSDGEQVSSTILARSKFGHAPLHAAALTRPVNLGV